MLTIYLVVLYGIPSTLRVSALGSMGSIGILVGLGTLIWWAWYRIQLREPIDEVGTNPVRIGVFVVGGALLLSYLAAMTRAIPSAEISPADTGMLRAAALIGVALLALDGPPNMDRFMVFVHRFALAGGLIAALGLLQFVTQQSLVDQIPLPGFVASADYSSLVLRGGLTRPAGTSVHPLEYAVILSMTLPITIVCALHARRGRAVGLWVMAGLIVLALMVSSSRSAYVGLAVSVIPLVFGLGRTARRWMIVGGVGLTGFVYIIAPRALTNLRYLFVAGADDPSVQSRTSSYAVIEALFPHFPFAGRGFGTFLPEYRIFDNEYLVLLMEIGVVGLLAVIGLLVAAAVGAAHARKRSKDFFTRDVGVALIASLAAGAALLALFDALSFPQAAGTLFLTIGLCGAYWRLLTHKLS
ncbi:O-antigen ligase [Cryobacterium sp. PAMC25264]|uniref:O-antigen ligase family protein n=1 Tax=Cryobacterium sp. PAMC25264 TaxID=2861288 RepID=UPI001C62DFB3|nr:O-antigen ligase family protein [Cryobacterium sp. PAMC25264]QYF72832.1 O-antigen ligase family protein [Cryobacterium sp. PAMC25264]